jgi:hypothetical protein
VLQPLALQQGCEALKVELPIGVHGAASVVCVC